MDLYGRFGAAEATGDLLVEQALQHEVEHGALAGRQAADQRSRSRPAAVLLAPATRDLEGCRHRPAEIRRRDGQTQEVDRTLLHGPDDQRRAGVGRHADHRDAVVGFPGQAKQFIRAGRKILIEQEAVGTPRARAIHEGGNVRECERVDREAPQRLPAGGAHRRLRADHVNEAVGSDVHQDSPERLLTARPCARRSSRLCGRPRSTTPSGCAGRSGTSAVQPGTHVASGRETPWTGASRSPWKGLRNDFIG